MRIKSAKTTSTKNSLITLAILAALLIGLRIPALIHPVLDVDEAIYSLFARIWFDGGIPYLDCVETKPLGIYLLFGTIFSIFGKWNMIAVHAVTIVIVGINSYIIYLIAKLLYSKNAGVWAAALYIIFSTTYIPKVIATTIEPIMLLPVTLMYYFWLRFERDDRNLHASLAGIFFSMACLFKYQAGMNLFVLITYIAIFGRPLKKSIRGLMYFVASGLLLPAVMLLYLYRIDAMEGFIRWNILGNTEYIKEGSTTISIGRQIIRRALPYMGSTLLLWLTTAVALFGLIRQRPISKQGALIALWFILSIIPVSTGYRFYGHYFLLLLPPMAILSSKYLTALFEKSGKVFLKGGVIFWIVIPAIGFTAARFQMDRIYKLVGEDNPTEYVAIAKYAAANTEPSDRILAWGYAPLVYWYAQRLPATRFFWSDLLTGRVPGTKGESIYKEASEGNPQIWKMFFEDLDRHAPKYIIDTTPADLHDYKGYPATKYPALYDYIKDNYREESTIDGTIFYRRIEQNP
ncbi:MAG TPA: glycosyltransferase family 39 protein [bacterium]|nr:glycosyltransferase family 39 protein [bacterium]